jgi:hypothetical protein
MTKKLQYFHNKLFLQPIITLFWCFPELVAGCVYGTLPYVADGQVRMTHRFSGRL